MKEKRFRKVVKWDLDKFNKEFFYDHKINTIPEIFIEPIVKFMEGLFTLVFYPVYLIYVWIKYRKVYYEEIKEWRKK